MSDETKTERFVAAENAIRDILYMYYVCIDYRCLFNDFGTEDGQFDPYYYIDCTEEETGYELEYKLLHEGSAIKLACNILQHWDQGGYPERVSAVMNKTIELVKSGRMNHLPELKEYIELALKSYDEATANGHKIYRKYIVGYFANLAGNST